MKSPIKRMLGEKIRSYKAPGTGGWTQYEEWDSCQVRRWRRFGTFALPSGQTVEVVNSGVGGEAGSTMSLHTTLNGRRYSCFGEGYPVMSDASLRRLAVAFVKRVAERARQ